MSGSSSLLLSTGSSRMAASPTTTLLPLMDISGLLNLSSVLLAYPWWLPSDPLGSALSLSVVCANHGQFRQAACVCFPDS